jgi:L-ascorbate metabolism protein UlaG (beta-lactamase superfamily)
LRLLFLGQSGVRIQAGSDVIYVDPYLSNFVAETAVAPERWRRRFPPPVDPGAIRDVTAVLCTHEHADHMDPRSLAPIVSNNPATRLLIPGPARDRLAETVDSSRLDLSRGDGDQHQYGRFRITGVPAAHSTGYDVECLAEGHRWQGFVIEAEGCRIYHAGDTVRHTEILDAVAALGGIDLALLPINGRDAARDQEGIIGNLSPPEAAALAVELNISIVVPIHHDLFERNGASAGELADHVQRCGMPLEVRVLPVGLETLLTARGMADRPVAKASGQGAANSIQRREEQSERF